MSGCQFDLFSRSIESDVDRLPAAIAEALAQSLGEPALRHLLAHSTTASVRRFTLAATLICEAMTNWDGTHKAAAQLARAAEFYRNAFGELAGAAGLVERSAFNPTHARRLQREAFHRARDRSGPG